MTQSPAPVAPDFVAPDGKECWRRDHALSVINDCKEKGYAILQARAWCVIRHIYDDLTVTEAIHLTPEEIRFFNWKLEVLWDEESESWEEFSRRTCKGASDFVTLGEADEAIIEKLKDTVHYYLEFIQRDEYLEE